MGLSATLPAQCWWYARTRAPRILSGLPPLQELDNGLDLVMHPTKQAVRDLVEEFGYSVSVLEPLFRNEKGELEWMGRGFRTGRRKAFVCAKKTDLSHLPAEVEPK
jgi:hypothetical protein